MTLWFPGKVQPGRGVFMGAWRGEGMLELAGVGDVGDLLLKRRKRPGRLPPGTIFVDQSQENREAAIDAALIIGNAILEAGAMQSRDRMTPGP